MLDGSAEERDGRGHEHCRRQAFAADVTDDERDIIAVPIEIIQVASYALHRHQRSMDRELVIIDEIVHQDTSLDVTRYVHLVLNEFMLILHLHVCFLVQTDSAEEKNENRDTDDQDA